MNSSASRHIQQQANSLVGKYGCGTCHAIPGIRGAEGQIGPPLNSFGKRIYVAGMLPNNPPNLIRWLKNPQEVVSGNAMPNMGLTDEDARVLATYLETAP
jgi:cytochrome c1